MGSLSLSKTGRYVVTDTPQEEKYKTLVLLGSVLALLGLGVSFYTLYHHIELKYFGAGGFVCNINDTLSCDDVARSRYSEDPWGNPLGVYGAAYFGGLLLLLLVGKFKEAFRRETLQAYAAMVVTGVVVSVSLGILSKVSIGKLCPTCMVIYAVTFFQVIFLYFNREALPRPFTWKETSNGAWYGIVTLVVAIGLFQMLKPTNTKNMTLDLPKDPKQFEEMQQDLKRQIEAAQAPAVLGMLDPNPSSAVKIDASAYSGLGEDYRKGSDDAKVKIVEFADYQCPACAGAAAVLKQLSVEFGDRVQIVFKNYPLDNSCNPSMPRALHAYACQAAKLARCAGSYGKFWELNTRMFENQSKIDETSLIAWSKDLGLTDAQIQQCLTSKDILNKIQDDINQGAASGLTGTPTLFFNGRKYNGPIDAEVIRRIIQALLEA